MANRSLFSRGKNRLPRANARNEAVGPAYALPPKHALTQLAATVCVSKTHYATAAPLLDELRKLIHHVDDVCSSE